MLEHRRREPDDAAEKWRDFDARYPVALRRLTAAYQAVVEQRGLAERVAEAERQAAALVGAAEARVRSLDQPLLDLGTTLTITLPGGLGELDVSAPRGHIWRPGDEAALEQFAALVESPINDARLLTLTSRLHRVGSLLETADDPAAVVGGFLDDGLQLCGARYGVVLLREGNVLRVVGARSSGRFAVGDIIPVDADRPLAEVARTGRPTFQPDLSSVRQFLAAEGVPPADAAEQAWVAVPIVSGQRLLGSLGLRFDGRQLFDAAQREFLTEAGRRLGAALERSEAFQNERRARLVAEEAAARVKVMRDLAVALSRAATRRAVADVLLRAVMETTAANVGLVATYRPHSHHIEMLAGEPRDRELYLPPVEIRRSINRILEVGEPLELRTIEDVERFLHTDIVAAEFGAASLGFYPIMFRRRQMGVVLLGWKATDDFDGFDREVLDTQIVMAGPVLQRAARYELEHEIADKLQRGLLTIPRFDQPALRWSTHYRAGISGLAGGDWYDVIRLDEHRVAFAVGDVVGRGVGAAAAMGQLRSATRALALRCTGPGEVLEGLDEFVRMTGAGKYSTVALVVADTRLGALNYAAGGHPPPLLRRPDGTTAMLEGGRSPLLGRGGHRPSAEAGIDKGDVVVLYTDGLVERRGESLTEGIDRAAVVLADECRSGDRRQLSFRLVERLLEGQQHADDVAVLTFTYLG